MRDMRAVRVLLEHLKKELDGKLECSDDAKQEIRRLIAEIDMANRYEVSNAKKGALATRCMIVVGALLKASIPEIRDFFGD